jgi:hypothetical protein
MFMLLESYRVALASTPPRRLSARVYYQLAVMMILLDRGVFAVYSQAQQAALKASRRHSIGTTAHIGALITFTTMCMEDIGVVGDADQAAGPGHQPLAMLVTQAW